MGIRRWRLVHEYVGRRYNDLPYPADDLDSTHLNDAREHSARVEANIVGLQCTRHAVPVDGVEANAQLTVVVMCQPRCEIHLKDGVHEAVNFSATLPVEL